jgi:hypothetical protein
MARQRKTLPARRQNATNESNESPLIRSAESLGRMIGALQRQLDAARQMTTRANGDAFRNGERRAKSAAAKQTASRKRSGAKQHSRRKTGGS